VGYGDLVLPPDWRIFGVCEAVAGTLMFGWSVGLLVILIERVTKQLV
jgi:hypothetical protein